MGQALITSKTATIANGGSLSGAVYVGEHGISAIVMPAAWTAADLTFQVSDDDGATFYELLDSTGAAVTLTGPTAANRYNVFSTDFQSATMFKVRSGTSGAPVAQGAARSLTLVCRKYYPRS